jgi:CRISPR-associated endonuclease/helicase Cas3
MAVVLSNFQHKAQEILKNDKSLLLVTPTGMGKTLAVTWDAITQSPKKIKIIYSCPLRALGVGIKKELIDHCSDNKNKTIVLHHGDCDESNLFGEDIIVTTYDQVVCGVPGLPLSLPLKAGHAVAGALLMSRLVFDEAHLSWAISDEACKILFGIIDFRQRFGLQTVIMTATMPNAVIELLKDKFGFEVLRVDEQNDGAFKLRKQNREVKIRKISKPSGKKNKKDGNKAWEPLHAIANELATTGKRIYFANTVERLHEIYDLLMDRDPSIEDKIVVLHNRMPKSQRQKAETQALDLFGKKSDPNIDKLLLTNQVAEAGLDISAPLVISDPAPADTLTQRAGRCARWFRDGKTKGDFVVVDIKDKEFCVPYKEDLVKASLKYMPSGKMSWEAECKWIDDAWEKQENGKPSKRQDQIEAALSDLSFALNLFDRATQGRSPGEIAKTFREILSVEVAVAKNDVWIDGDDGSSPATMLAQYRLPETSTVSYGSAWGLLKKTGYMAMTITNEDGDYVLKDNPSYIQPGDILLVPPSVAYLHPQKGLCFVKNTPDGTNDTPFVSEWRVREEKLRKTYNSIPNPQTLLSHSVGVAERFSTKFESNSTYRHALEKILSYLHRDETDNSQELIETIISMGMLGAMLHDIGKSNSEWQSKARSIDATCTLDGELIGRTAIQTSRIGVPHGGTAYAAVLEAINIVFGNKISESPEAVAIALAATRHHNAFTSPSDAGYHADKNTNRFLYDLMDAFRATSSILNKMDQIIEACENVRENISSPLMLPNLDTFSLYALIGRAILISDREDASGKDLEVWR